MTDKDEWRSVFQKTESGEYVISDELGREELVELAVILLEEISRLVGAEWDYNMEFCVSDESLH